MVVIKYIRLPFLFDKNRLQQEVQQLMNENWLLHYQTIHYEGAWSAIPLRSVGGKPDDVVISPLENAIYADTIFLQKSDYLRQVLASFQCPLKAVRLLKLGAGSIIKEHKDAELNFERGEVRIHIPVITNEDVIFHLDNESFHMQEGECWYMNFNLPHSIYNNGKTDRVHLVIDAVVNDWTKELFARPDLLKKEIEEPGFDAETKMKIIAQLRLLNTDTANNLADEMEASLKENSAPS